MQRKPAAEQKTLPDVSLYRIYSEALLRRFVKMSFESARTPSFLGREMFRGKVTHYRVEGVDDAIIFCRDMELAVQTLSAGDALLVRKIAMLGHTRAEAASLLGLSLRTVVRGYSQAIDRLSRHLLRVGLLAHMQYLDAPGNMSSIRDAKKSSKPNVTQKISACAAA